jgi:hypothetical protein
MEVACAGREWRERSVESTFAKQGKYRWENIVCCTQWGGCAEGSEVLGNELLGMRLASRLGLPTAPGSRGMTCRREELENGSVFTNH